MEQRNIYKEEERVRKSKAYSPLYKEAYAKLFAKKMSLFAHTEACPRCGGLPLLFRKVDNLEKFRCLNCRHEISVPIFNLELKTR